MLLPKSCQRKLSDSSSSVLVSFSVFQSVCLPVYCPPPHRTPPHAPAACTLSAQPALPTTTIHTCSASATKPTWLSSAHHHTVYQLHSDLQSLLDRLSVHVWTACRPTCQPTCFVFFYQLFTPPDSSFTLCLDWLHPHYLCLCFLKLNIVYLLKSRVCSVGSFAKNWQKVRSYPERKAFSATLCPFFYVEMPSSLDAIVHHFFSSS